MVVVARDDSPLGLILAVIALVTIVVAVILIFAVSRMGGNVALVVIPGFPIEAITLGILLGLTLVLFRRRRSVKR